MVTGGSTQTIESGGEATYTIAIQSDSKMYFSVNDVDDLEVMLLPEAMYSTGSLSLKVKAGRVAEDTTVNIDVEIDYITGTMTFPMVITIAADTTQPSVSEMVDQDGNTIADGSEVMWNDTLIFEFSEPISADSFHAAETAKTLKVEWGGKEVDADFELSEDGRTMTVQLEPLELMGTITISFEGLKDEAGLDISQDTLELKVKGKETDDDESGYAWIIIIVVLIVLILIAVGIYFVMNSQKNASGDEEKKDSNEMPPEPKQI
jgi:hypothetical protein